ncbi:hypothetical protein MHZ92_02600 [Sporosarcina sp. ACRSL]|uniref:hypothetical protein n=1 Tax=Sporosarcina sp. ACRSL TaxID=2918215 RepID=UPI001EF56DD1|nr:hypothetical protein [Sporosarcina sp. ACRSL]MCG7343005.1 hypothetical protein [Sporosarcina sp. ACRSL]
MKWKAATPPKAVTKNGFCDQKQSVGGRNGKTDALISAKIAEILQIEPFAVRLAEATPAEREPFWRFSAIKTTPDLKTL